MDNDKIENFFAYNHILKDKLKKLQEDEIIDKEIKQATANIVKTYINTMLSEEELKLVRRKK